MHLKITINSKYCLSYLSLPCYKQIETRGNLIREKDENIKWGNSPVSRWSCMCDSAGIPMSIVHPKIYG